MNIFRPYILSNAFKISSAMSRSTKMSRSVRGAMNVKGGAKNIVWMDLEMTGLNIQNDHILEIACLVTDAKLNVLATGPDLVIHQPDDILNNMDSWCVMQHGESGLTEASRNSKVSVKDAENQILKFVKAYVPENKCPLAGNSVYMDRLFIRKYMPRLNEYLHYRIIDVSTIKELAKRWFPKEFSNIPQKKFKHRSIDDIKESIKELQYYRENVFKSKEFYCLESEDKQNV